MTSAASLRALLAAALALLLVSCDRPVGERPVLQLSGSTMGTTFDIQLVSPPENVQKNVLEGQVLALLARIEQSMSTYEPESEL